MPVRVANLTEDPIPISAGTIVAKLDVAEVCEIEEPATPKKRSEQDPALRQMVANVDSSVGRREREQLAYLLDEFSDAFSVGENDLGWTDIVTHAIDTGDSKPVRQLLRRHPPAHNDAIQKHVSDMLEQGVIEPAKSPWASNVVLVKKKDGSLRCCIDYRQVNATTRKDAYPLPRTDMCLDAMSGAQWFSTFDLRSSYHQVAMKPEDADKTAFICREGQFKFTTMPFGLCNAGATFQRLMDMIMAGLAYEVCLVYLDDVIVFSSTVEEHFTRLRLVLSKLRDAGLKLKPSKCRLLQKQVSFLGHVVSGEGIETDPEKVRVVADWPVPVNLREVRSFVGLCSYYRRFVKDFARISSPLHALTKKNASFRWDDECQEAFEALKGALTSAPVLAMPDDESAFVLDTDASHSAIGAVLSQKKAGVEHVVAYASRKMSKAECNYSATRKELLAVVSFIKYFKHFLLGRHFVVRTDHAALQWLWKTPEPVGQQARWVGFLEEFDFDVVHRPGRHHVNADALSRIPCRSDEDSCRTIVQVNQQLERLVDDESLCDERNAGDGAFNLDQPTGTELEDGLEVPVESLTAVIPDVQNDSDEAGMIVNNAGILDWSSAEMTLAQQADRDIGVISTMLYSNAAKPPWSEVAVYGATCKSLWHQWERLVLHDGVIYRRFYSCDGVPSFLQLVVPYEYRNEFIRLAHEGMTGGHLGRKRTEAQVRNRGYWPGWTDDVRRFLRKCGPCSRYHRGPPPKLAEMQPMLVGEPFERVSVDITGPHPRSAKGHVFMLTVMDHFSKWAEAIPLRNHTAPTVARTLMTHVFSRFGMPLQLLTDRGPEFEGELFTELCKWMEIDKIRTTAYRAATNGMVERFHRTLNAILGKIISENQRDWCEKVPVAAAAYRASVHEATGYTPNRLMLGRETRAPLDIVVGCSPEEQQSYESTDQFVAERQQRMREMYSVVREHLRRAAERRKKNYDVRVKPAQFKEGDWVWYYYPRRYAQKSPKWQSLYTGPFKVTRILPPSNAVIQRSKRTQPFVVHFEKLKRCYKVPPTSAKQAPVGLGSDNRDGPVGHPAAMGQNLSPTQDVQGERTGSGSSRRPRRSARRPERLRDYV